MGFMDKMKEQAAVVTAVAKDTAQKGQSKVEEVQAKRAADEVLRQLGLVVFLEKAGRGDGTTEASIARHVETLKEYEAEFGELGPTDSSGGAG
jgi:hypothetical protein